MVRLQIKHWVIVITYPAHRITLFVVQVWAPCQPGEECEQLEPHQMKILIVCLLNTTTVKTDVRQSLAIVDMREQ